MGIWDHFFRDIPVFLFFFSMPAIPRDLAALQPGKFLKKEKNSLPKKNPLERIKKNSQKSQKFPPRIPGKFTTRRDCQGAAPTSSRKIQHSQKTNAWSLFTTRKTQGIPNLGKKRAGNGSHSQKKPRRRGLAPIPAASPKKKSRDFGIRGGKIPAHPRISTRFSPRFRF